MTIVQRMTELKQMLFQLETAEVNEKGKDIVFAMLKARISELENVYVDSDSTLKTHFESYFNDVADENPENDDLT